MIGGVADSGSNMSGALNQFGNDFISIPCAAHRLNLSVNEMLLEKKIKTKGLYNVRIYIIITKKAILL